MPEVLVGRGRRAASWVAGALVALYLQSRPLCTALCSTVWWEHKHMTAAKQSCLACCLACRC